MTDDKRPPTTTTDSGVPVPSDEHSLTAGPNGPTLLHVPGVPIDLAPVTQAHVADGHGWSVRIARAERGEAEQDGAHDAAVTPARAVRTTDPLRTEVPGEMVGTHGREQHATQEPAVAGRADRT